MTTYTKHIFSESEAGEGILISASATPGTAIHTSASSAMDEVWLYAVNTSVVDTKLTVEWGGTVAPNGNIEGTIEGGGGLVLIIPGLILTSGCPVTAFASASAVIVAHGFVNRIG